MFKAPIKTDGFLNITQDYGNKSNNDWYKANGLNLPFHNGIDIAIGLDSRKTYGTELVCPFANAQVVKVNWDAPTSTKGNGVTIQSDILDGFIYQVVFWHTGEIVVELGQKLVEGDLICYIGNSGLCYPAPSASDPWGGAHLHLMVFKYKQLSNGAWILCDADNGVGGARNPTEIFNFNLWYKGKDTGVAHDQIVLWQWVKDLSGWNLVNYLKKIKFW